MDNPATHEDLGRTLAEMIDQMETQRLFTGDLEGEFVVPLSDGGEYLVTVARKDDARIDSPPLDR